MIWTIISWVCLLIFVLIWVIAIKKIRRVSNQYKKDDLCLLPIKKYKVLIKKKVEVYSNNIYVPDDDEKDPYLDYFMISRRKNKIFLRCKFKMLVEVGNVIAIRIFNDYGIYIKTLFIECNKPIDQTDFIPLSINDRIGNIEILENKNEIVEKDLVRIKRLKEYQKFALMFTISLMFLFIPLSYELLANLTGYLLYLYLNVATISLGVLLIALVMACTYFSIILWMKKRYSLGGIVYEHVEPNL